MPWKDAKWPVPARVNKAGASFNRWPKETSVEATQGDQQILPINFDREKIDM